MIEVKKSVVRQFPNILREQALDETQMHEIMFAQKYRQIFPCQQYVKFKNMELKAQIKLSSFTRTAFTCYFCKTSFSSHD